MLSLTVKRVGDPLGVAFCPSSATIVVLRNEYFTTLARFPSRVAEKLLG